VKPALVTLDLWNTLYYESRERPLRDVQLDALATALAEAGVEIGRKDVAAAYDDAWTTFLEHWRANQHFTLVEGASICADRLAELVPVTQELRPLVHDALLRGCRDAEFVVVEGARDFLALTRRHGIETAVVCDVGFTPSSILRERLRADGLLQYLDAFAFSDEVGCFKPDPRIFRHALRRFPPTHRGRVVHVGDGRRTDVVGAQRLGLVAVRFATIYDDLVEAEGPSGDFVVYGYGELASLLSLDEVERESHFGVPTLGRR
jgi:putative hydrolase of the HAD superfamily